VSRWDADDLWGCISGQCGAKLNFLHATALRLGPVFSGARNAHLEPVPNPASQVPASGQSWGRAGGFVPRRFFVAGVKKMTLRDIEAQKPPAMEDFHER
jgi:hypothetical protein